MATKPEEPVIKDIEHAEEPYLDEGDEAILDRLLDERHSDEQAGSVLKRVQKPHSECERGSYFAAVDKA